MSGDESRSAETEGVPESAHHVGAASALEVGDHLLTEIHGVEIAVYRTDDGYFGVSNYCVHQGGPICEGPVSGRLTEDEDGRLCYDRENEIVRCPWHGWEFDITTGEHLSRDDYSQPTYDVLVRDGDLYVRW